MKFCNVPTMLTLIRLITSPLILPLLFVYLLPFNIFWVNVTLALIFSALSLTDFFDGYLARKLHQETVVGKVLDPIADKFLISSALIALLAAGKIYFYWVILLIGRELFVTGLRIIALEHQCNVPVSWLGKIKTTAQMFTIVWIILNPHQARGIYAVMWNGTEFILLIITLFLSLYSAWVYYQKFMAVFIPAHEMNQEEQ